jgi:alpha/beta superfamily hydrolase
MGQRKDMMDQGKPGTGLLEDHGCAPEDFSVEGGAVNAGMDHAARMQAVEIDGLFGWLHSAPAGLKNDVAVLICPALNRDGLDSYHGLRLLADAFASAGHPTLRFNYPATGDSCDLEEVGFTATEHWAAWQKSVHVAADWLRAATGARRLILCGLRIGATLAALTAEHRDDVAGLILLAPVLRGRSYLRQLSIEAGIQRGAVAAMDKGLEFEELHFSAATVQLIEQIDLRHVRLSAGYQVAIFSQSSSSPLNACVRAWTEQGVKLACRGFDGLAPMLQHTLEGEGAPVDFSEVMEWVAQVIPTQRYLAADVLEADAVLHPAGCMEIPVQFGPDKRLFGMLCRPDRDDGEIAVIIGNAGRDPHYGNAGFGTEFARQLAGAGVASLRIDFAGLGDSIGPFGKENVLTHVLERDRTEDIGAAIDLMAQLGYRVFVVHGICAGAYHAFHAALADSRIGMILLVDMPVFTWMAGDAVELVKRKALRPGHYVLKLASRKFWGKLFRRELDIGGILGAQMERLGGQIRGIALAAMGVLQPETFAQQALGTLSKRGVKTLFLYQPDNGGLEMFEENFGAKGSGLSRFGGAAIQFVPDVERRLSYDQTLRIGGRMMIEFLTSRLPGAASRQP